MSTIINASTSSGLVQTADTSGTLVLQSNGTTMQTIDSTGSYGQLKSGTAQASTSGTSIDFTSIPSWVKRITVMFDGVSTNGSSNIQIQIGSGSFSTTGYLGAASSNGTAASANSTTGLILTGGSAASCVYFGLATICLIGSNKWACSGNLGRSDSNVSNAAGSSSPALSGALDRVRITTVNGTDTFDAGSINILYEG